jgi:translation elongation factor EF-G
MRPYHNASTQAVREIMLNNHAIKNFDYLKLLIHAKYTNQFVGAITFVKNKFQSSSDEYKKMLSSIKNGSSYTQLYQYEFLKLLVEYCRNSKDGIPAIVYSCANIHEQAIVLDDTKKILERYVFILEEYGNLARRISAIEQHKEEYVDIQSMQRKGIDSLTKHIQSYAERILKKETIPEAEIQTGLKLKKLRTALESLNPADKEDITKIVQILLYILVTTHPSPTSRGLTAESRNLATSLDPAVKPRDVGSAERHEQLHLLNDSFDIKLKHLGKELLPRLIPWKTLRSPQIDLETLLAPGGFFPLPASSDSDEEEDGPTSVLCTARGMAAK